MNIRHANAADLDALAAATVRLQDSHVAAYPSIYVPLTLVDARALLTERLQCEDTSIRVAVVVGEIVGHTVYQRKQTLPTVLTRSRGFLYLSQISVDPKHLGRGVGTALLSDVVETARADQLPRIELDVWEFNETAREFFKACGFQVFGHRMSQDLLA